MKFQSKRFQTNDLARSALHDGAVLAWDKGGGKTIAAFLWSLLKRKLCGEDNKEWFTLIVAPGSLHEQFIDEAWSKFGIRLRRLGSQKEFHEDADLQRRVLARLNSPPSALRPQPSKIKCLFLPTLATLAADVFDCTIVDEAVRMQGTESYISTGVRTLRSRFRLVGTATPVKNYLDSLFWLAHWACGAPGGASACPGIAEGDARFWITSYTALGYNGGDQWEPREADNGELLVSSKTLEYRAAWIERNGSDMSVDEVGRNIGVSEGPDDPADKPNARWPYENSDTAKSRFSNEFMMIERNISAEERAMKLTGRYRKIEKKLPRICNLHRLWKLVSPVIIRRRKSDMDEDIVPKTFIPIRSKLGTAQRAVYQFHLLNKPKYRKDGEIMSKIAAAMTQLQMLRQAALCPDTMNLGMGNRSWTDFNPKQAAILAIIGEKLSIGEQVVVMSPFQHFSDTLHRRLRQARVSVCLLDGKMDERKRGRFAKAFKRREFSVMIGGIKSMGEGHSFSQCNNLILPSLEWAFDNNDQAIDRVHRLDSEKPVNIYVMVGEKTIDERLESLFREKGDCASLALDGRLFAEERKDVNLAELLADAVRDFDATADTIDEKDIESQWDSLCGRLMAAESRFREWHPPIVPVPGTSRHSPAGTTTDNVTPTDITAAMAALTQPAFGQRSNESAGNAETVGLERVMHFFAEKAVLCKYTQASSLGWHKKYSKHEAREPAIRAMLATRNGSFARPI